MADGDGLGLAGGARRVEGVRDVFRVQADVRSHGRLIGEHRGALLEHEQPCVGVRERPGVRAAHQDDRGAGFRAHLGETRGRQRWIKRQVRTARLQDREQAANRFDAALEADSDQGLLADAHFLQMVRQLIGRLVQLTICQLTSRRDDRGRVRAGEMPARRIGRARTAHYARAELRPESRRAEAPADSRPDADRSNVRPGGGNGSQAGPSGHNGRPLPPAGRKDQFRWPDRVLALVVDGDDAGTLVR